MRCRECDQEVVNLDNIHLSECSGLTLQEYAIRHHISLDLLISESMVNAIDSENNYSLPGEMPSKRAETVIEALKCVDAFKEEQKFLVLDGEVRRLDQLLWYLRELQAYGFQFRQEYQYTKDSHRVLALNRIKSLLTYAHKHTAAPNEIDFDLLVAVIVAQIGEFYSGYVFLPIQNDERIQGVLQKLTGQFQIRWQKLDGSSASCTSLYRTESLQDAQRLLKLIESNLQEIPCARERFFAETEYAVVNKELVFDSAHFITDHPDKCENLHGGRYTVNVKVKGRIDPLSGFVIDYGYLKAVVKQRVIQRLDHQTLNYACADLGWRSSTELLNIFMWEQLIDYLPGLFELQTYETTQSYCTYRGPDLEQTQKTSQQDALKHFNQPDLGKSILRNLLCEKERNVFKVMG